LVTPGGFQRPRCEVPWLAATRERRSPGRWRGEGPRCWPCNNGFTSRQTPARVGLVTRTPPRGWANVARRDTGLGRSAKTPDGHRRGLSSAISSRCVPGADRVRRSPLSLPATGSQSRWAIGVRPAWPERATTGGWKPRCLGRDAPGVRLVNLRLAAPSGAQRRYHHQSGPPVKDEASLFGRSIPPQSHAVKPGSSDSGADARPPLFARKRCNRQTFAKGRHPTPPIASVSGWCAGLRDCSHVPARQRLRGPRPCPVCVLAP
jgi:hypothetical protein